MSQVLVVDANRAPADLVAEVAAQAGIQQPAQLRRLTVDLRIEAQAADDSFLSPLVAEAILEFVHSPEGRGEGSGAMQGKFESRGGLDVSWHATNEYFEGGHRVMEVKHPAHQPVPLSVGYLEHHGDGMVCLVVGGVRYALEVFKTLANPDPAKRYQFVRQGDTVNVVERP